jgi:quercetin dioxygenase-like cupin family protein
MILERNWRLMKRTLVSTLAVVLTVACHAAFGDKPGTSEYQQDIKVTVLLKTGTTTLGQPIECHQTSNPEVTALQVEIAPGKETGWHRHPVPGYAYVLSGTLAIEMEDGQHFQFEAGKAFAEVISTLHNGKNLGKEPVILLVFFTGEAGKPFTVRAVKE